MTRGRPFQKGESGNPAGRPRGSRNALSEDFLTTLAADFAEHGAHVIASVRQTSPDTYLRVIASLSARVREPEAENPIQVVIRRELADL